MRHLKQGAKGIRQTPIGPVKMKLFNILEQMNEIYENPWRSCR
jgi:hypothetical protein